MILLPHRLLLPIMYVYYPCYIPHAMFPSHIYAPKIPFVLSFMCDIIWPPAPFKIYYLARNLKELHEPALGNVLSRRFHMCSIEVKNTLFRSFCTPMYTCQLWWNFSVQSTHKLNVAYNNAFRFMHHLPTYCSASLMFVVNRVPNCRAVTRNRIYGFMKRLVSSSNALALSTVTSDARFRSRIVRHWLKSLYIHFDAG